MAWSRFQVLLVSSIPINVVQIILQFETYMIIGFVVISTSGNLEGFLSSFKSDATETLKTFLPWHYNELSNLPLGSFNGCFIAFT